MFVTNKPSATSCELLRVALRFGALRSAEGRATSAACLPPTKPPSPLCLDVMQALVGMLEVCVTDLRCAAAGDKISTFMVAANFALQVGGPDRVCSDDILQCAIKSLVSRVDVSLDPRNRVLLS